MTVTHEQADEPKITHIRLCECGRPAGHNSICLSNAAERSWVAVEAGERRDRSDARKQRVANDRRTVRSRLTEWQLVNEAREGEILLSTVGAANTAAASPSSESTRVGPTTQRLDDDPRYRLAKWQLRRAAGLLIEIQEEIRGHGMAATATVQLGEHKDAEILKCVGLKPREVVAHLGSEVAGGVRTVERVREAPDPLTGKEHCRWCGQVWPS